MFGQTGNTLLTCKQGGILIQHSIQYTCTKQESKPDRRDETEACVLITVPPTHYANTYTVGSRDVHEVTVMITV